MEENMMDNGLTIKCMEKDYILGKIEVHMRDNGLMIKWMDKAHILG